MSKQARNPRTSVRKLSSFDIPKEAARAVAQPASALGEVRAALEDQIAALRRELNDARTQIKELQRAKSAPLVIGWRLDRIKYRDSILCGRQTGNADPPPTAFRAIP